MPSVLQRIVPPAYDRQVGQHGVVSKAERRSSDSHLQTRKLLGCSKNRNSGIRASTDQHKDGDDHVLRSVLLQARG